MRKLAIVAAVSLVLSACAGGDLALPYEGGPASPSPSEQRPSPAEHLTPPPVTSAGPLKTAMIGSYMDNQERDLRQVARGTGAIVARPGDDIVLHLRSDEIFEPNSLMLNDSGQRLLFAIAPVLRRYDHTAIFIDGYTDTSGTADRNTTVSRKRAYTVGGELVKDGVPLARLQAAGHGEDDLKIKTGDHVNEPRNRRIEIRIVAKAQG